MQQRRRNRFILGLLALGLVAGVALTALPAQAVDGVGPYYAVPSWDRQMAPVNRFVVLTNWNSKAVLDKETGLVWERSPQVEDVSWQNASSSCLDRTVGNRKGWRLPALPELASLIDPSQVGPALPLGHPFAIVQFGGYWSATTYADDPTNAWHVILATGVVSIHFKTLTYRVWCVRGGVNADAY